MFILSSEEFTRGFVPDGILLRGFFYSLSARTGNGKTAVALSLTAALARGKDLSGRTSRKVRYYIFAICDAAALCYNWLANRCEKVAMNSLRGRRDPRTGRVFGFQSETQRDNFMIARARFCNGLNREMPRCTALNRLGKPCKAARMRGRSTCFRHSGSGVAKRARLAAAHLSGDLDRIQRAEMRSERNRLCALWRRDPREPGKTIMLVPADEATCRVWAARQGFQLDLLDRDLPAVSDACRWIWARMSRGLISDRDLTTKLARLRSRIMEVGDAFNHSR